MKEPTRQKESSSPPQTKGGKGVVYEGWSGLWGLSWSKPHLLFATLDEFLAKDVGLYGHKTRPYPEWGLDETCALRSELGLLCSLLVAQERLQLAQHERCREAASLF